MHKQSLKQFVATEWSSVFQDTQSLRQVCGSIGREAQDIFVSPTTSPTWSAGQCMNQTLQPLKRSHFQSLCLHEHVHKLELFCLCFCSYCFGWLRDFAFFLYWILLLFEKSFLPMYLGSVFGICFLCTYHATCTPGHHHWSGQQRWANCSHKTKETF